ncbi:MAG: tetratricopeptide repeat protein [Erythrobacter sp.]|uniref:tetratricopeptide repeat protein n=1 Tax=Erythrobacter sp. TaxID=1042 RepID=UPI00261D349E|nr:tetratricopeptide repeat protein [Erythrobacter sp.]MDJ0977445.1 tetratricopeptide repeat protein [Erythrobacter sp.]
MPDAAARLCVFLTALALTACGAVEAAQTNLPKKSFERGEEPVEALIIRAQEGDSAKAARLLDRALAREPRNPDVWVAIARMRYRSGEQLSALEAADHALDLGPRHAPALVLRGQFVRDAFGLIDALVWFESALEADPHNPDALAEYAATLGDAGYNAEMLAAARRLAEVAPENPRSLFLKSVLAARGGQPVLAKSLLERSGLAAEGIPSAMMLDALIDLNERNYASASKTLEALVQKQPANREAADLLARAMWLGGRDAELVARFVDAASGKDASPYLLMLVGRAYERQGNRAAASDFLARAYAGRQDGWVSFAPKTGLPEATVRVRKLIGQGRLRDAVRETGRLHGRFPKSSDIAVLSGDAALAGDQPERALELYRRAARLRRSWPLTLKAVAAYRDLGDTMAADVLLARHLRGEPQNAEALMANAQQAAQKGDWRRVEALLDHAIKRGASNNPRLLQLRADAARALAKDAEAGRFERRAWELDAAIPPRN